MPARIRLQRQGRKRHPIFHIVITDARNKRDGRYIERIGSYNPNTNPATIELNFDSALKWLENGAQPSDTAKAILSYKGILYKNHLNKGVKKGALTQVQADAKFDKWLGEKESKIQAKIDLLANESISARKERLAKEVEQNKARESAIAAKQLASIEQAEAATEEETVAAVEQEVKLEEAPVAEVTTEEAPAAVEAKIEETPAAESEDQKEA